MQGAFVGTIRATDKDEGPFRELVYKIEAVVNTTGGGGDPLENHGLKLVESGPDEDGFNSADLVVNGDGAWVDRYGTYDVKVKVSTI